MSNTFEILARGRCSFGGGKWYEGDVRHHHNGTVTIRPKASTDGLGYYVEPSTVTAYVQRTDKNGKHVFDGDICRDFELEPDGELWEDCFYVGFDPKDCAFCVDGRHGEQLPDPETFNHEIEVIGNKFDNPEMFAVLYARAHGKGVQDD